jgi:hypothetical protein
MGLGHGGPHVGGGLAEQFVRFGGKFLSAAEMLWSGHGCSTRLAVGYCSDTAQAHRRTPGVGCSTIGIRRPGVAASASWLLVQALACCHDREDPC